MTNLDELKHNAKGVVIEQIDRRTTQLGNVVGGHVNNLYRMSDSFRDQGQDTTARLVALAAERLNAVSTYLTQADGDRIIHDIETVARTQPMVTAAAGFILGLAAARVLKAGAVARYRMSGEPSSIADDEIDYGIR